MKQIIFTAFVKYLNRKKKNKVNEIKSKYSLNVFSPTKRMQPNKHDNKPPLYYIPLQSRDGKE